MSRAPTPTDTAEATSAPQSCTAFLGMRRIAFGSYDEVARALASSADLSAAGLLVFDDASGAQMDYPWPAACAQAAAAASPCDRAAAPAVGRPRLGVVAREVTLLPRHWAWLSQQPGGASAALRRLVDEARRTHATRDARRQATERAYRFMSAIAGGLPGFEEAARALFAHDGAGFDRCIAHWPADVRSHLAFLARDAFGADPAGQPQA